MLQYGNGIYCFVCNKVIQENEDAELFEHDQYKHRKCFSVKRSEVIYLRRTIELDESLFFIPYKKENEKLNKCMNIFKYYGARILYYNSEEVQMIYPDNFPERLIKYHGDIIACDLWGIIGIRKNVEISLPENFIYRKIPINILFKNYGKKNQIFMPVFSPIFSFKKLNFYKRRNKKEAV
jgi:hypothetical protein